jgi:apolipoprotein N-acyltransferase
MNKNKQDIPNIFYLISFLAGASLVFAFAPFGIYPIAWLSIAVLFYTLLYAQNKKQHVYLAWLYGIGMFGTGTSWVFYSMHFYGHASIPIAATLTTVFVVLIALMIGLFGLLAYFFRYHHKVTRLLLIYPLLWVVIEWTRGWFLTGFPWLYLGNSQIDTVLANSAPITGVLGVSLLSAMISGSLASLIILKGANTLLWINIPNSNHIKVQRKNRFKHQFIALFIILSTFAGSWSIGQITWTQSTGKTITASLIQGNILQEEKWLPENKHPTLALYKKLTEQHWDSDLIIWPETAIPDIFARNMDDFILPLQQQAQAHNTDLLIGAFYKNPQGKTENSVLSLTPTEREIYSKRHLVPMTEYVPLLGYLHWLNDWIKIPPDNLTAGTTATTLTLAGQRAQISICYEDAFANETLKGLPQATFLINVSNDGWFTDSLEPHQHMEIARMRALETGRYLLRVTNTGVSGIVDTKGRLIATAPPYSTQVITHKIQPFTGSTPFVYWGNEGIIALIFLLLLLGYFFAETRKPKTHPRHKS